MDVNTLLNPETSDARWNIAKNVDFYHSVIDTTHFTKEETASCILEAIAKH